MQELAKKATLESPGSHDGSMPLPTWDKKKKKNIYFANSKNNYNTNIMCKHRGGFPEGQSPIVLDTLAMLNITSNIKEKNKQKQFTIYYTSTIMNIHLFYQCN